jgi:phage baseplate assembly protein W
MAGYSGLSFPPRIGINGRWVMSQANNLDTTHLKEAIRLALLTRLGERVMEYAQGSRVSEAVFENMDSTLVSVLEYKIQEAIARLEPRVQVLTVTITFNKATAQVMATVTYRIKDSQIIDTTTVKISTQ